MLSDLKKATTLSDVAHLLKVKPGMLSFLLYKKPSPTRYKKFEIAKSNGGTREIWAPNSNLKLLQHRLSELLQNCSEEIKKSHGHADGGDFFEIAHGFKRNHTIITNARVHITRRFVFNTDLSDFFGSINFGRVRGFFLKDKNFSLNKRVATILAQIACHENKLPQGSPCSPVISNLIGHTLDILLARLAEKRGCSYSRYADDLTFSTNKRIFPSEIAAIQDIPNSWVPGNELARIVTQSGFSFNQKKTRMQYRDSRQEVTGLVVNRKVNVPASYRNTLRAMLHNLFKTGKFKFSIKRKTPLGKEDLVETVGHSSQLLGMLSYIDHVDEFNKNLYLENKIAPTETPGRITLFRRFLYFDAFYAPSIPVIVCEGKTDNIYIKYAIKSLGPAYPSLFSPGKKSSLKIKLFKYSDRRTSHITELTGGVGGICHLIKYYFDDCSRIFTAPPPKHPVIILIDNDSGSDSVYGAIAGITKSKKPAGKAPFIHVTKNLYVVPTPLGAGGKQTMIEDFFDDATRGTVLNGKTFDPGKDADNTKNYSKAIFAHYVVAKNFSSIDFSAFKEILDRFELVINDYAAKLKKTP